MKTTRRGFVKTSLGTSSLLALDCGLARLGARAAAPRLDTRGNVLVVVQLSGGNDGLNTVVPFEDDAYHRARPTLRLSADKVRRIGDGMGFHPEMPAFERLYKDGLLGIVQGVGYPKSSRNHDAALRDWHTARPGDAHCQTGWLGRTADHLGAVDPARVPAIFVGPINTPFALHAAEAVVPSIRSLKQAAGAPGGGGHWRRMRRLTDPAATATHDDSLLSFIRGATRTAGEDQERIAALAAAGGPVGAYPDFPLAADLGTVAQLIRAELGIRIFFVELGGGGIGGFDSHANQAANHGALLRQLSEAIAAFVDDLKRDRLLDRVALLTVSEFGRTVAENGRRGTDHGIGAPLFLAGGRIRPGLVGAHPSLTDLDGGAQKFHTDFRSVYATLLDRWLGFDSAAVLGRRFEPVDLLAA